MLDSLTRDDLPDSVMDIVDSIGIDAFKMGQKTGQLLQAGAGEIRDAGQIAQLGDGHLHADA